MAGAIVVLGGLNYDFVLQADRLPRPGETVEGRRFYTSGGGKGANQAVAAARLADPGTPVRLIGRVGDDAEGRALLALLEGDGVDCAGVATDPAARSGVAMIVLDAEGENTVLAVYGANARCGEAELAALERALPGAGVLLVQQEIPLSVTAAAMHMARAQGVRVVLDPAPVRPALPDDFHVLADILTPNRGEAEALIRGPGGGPASSATEAAVALRDRGIANVIVTLAADGAVLADAGGGPVTTVPGHRVRPVASVGAGDAFNGALAVALSEGRPIAEAAAFANAAAALAVTRPGVQEAMPRRAAVEQLMRGR